ncbi:MAG: enolase C-terminal domain-like protein [Burkholderiaceae bacterium]
MNIEIRPYRLALQVPYRWSKGTQHHRMGLILRLQAGAHIGWGEAALPPHVNYTPQAFAQECAAILSDLDPLAPDFLTQLDQRECPARLRCGASTALLTLRASEAGLPLAAYLMRCQAKALPDRVPVNDLIGDADPAMCASRANEAAARGQDTVKVKCTPERELDLQRVGAIRKAQPHIRIRIDPNESWPLEWAAEQLNAMAAFNIAYCEEPLPRGTPLADYGQLRQQTRVAIALDDSIRTLRDVELAVLHKAADMFIVKAQRVGGPDRLLEIVRAATAAGIRCTITSSIETSVGLYLGIHCTAMTPAPMSPAGIGTARIFAENVCEPPPIVHGFMALPQRPGLGFDPQPWWDAQG